VAGVLLIALAFGSGFAAASVHPRQQRAEPTVNTVAALDHPLGLFKEAWDLVKQDFFGPLPPNREQVYSAIRGVLDTLDDPYTVLVEPVPRQFEQDDLRGSYGGVGVHLDRDVDGQIVLSPFRDSPAARAGVLEGDVLLAVDDLPITAELDITEDVTSQIRGEVGTTVTLTIQRGAEVFTLIITRQVIEVPSVSWRLLEQSSSLGYVKVTSFTDRTADELKEGLDELYASNIRGLVLDLRDNGGGLLQSAIDVADQFLDGGVLLYESRKGQEEKSYSATDGGQAVEIPLVVLINQGTASASEIVAGAIQARERGMLIGTPTFGKGSVQLIFDLSDGSSLHITAARWYTPNRNLIDGVGLNPTIPVEVGPDDEVDYQLRQAIEVLEEADYQP
jgi:carboxyl-terminal processing protease